MARVAVRNLNKGTIVMTGEVVVDVFRDTTTPAGKRKVILGREKNGKKVTRLACWNAGTMITVGD